MTFPADIHHLPSIRSSWKTNRRLILKLHPSSLKRFSFNDQKKIWISHQMIFHSSRDKEITSSSMKCWAYPSFGMIWQIHLFMNLKKFQPWKWNPYFKIKLRFIKLLSPSLLALWAIANSSKSSLNIYHSKSFLCLIKRSMRIVSFIPLDLALESFQEVKMKIRRERKRWKRERERKREEERRERREMREMRDMREGKRQEICSEAVGEFIFSRRVRV